MRRFMHFASDGRSASVVGRCQSQELDSKQLGYASITTTQRYVDHIATAELLATVPPLPWATVG
jgi:hypothetical protein